MDQNHYVIRGGLKGRERLRVLARVMRPATRGLLERVGVQQGMSCLDVGCGGGDATLEFAQIVGPSGRVVGIDIDEMKIELAQCEAAQTMVSWVEFRVSEIGRFGGGAEFDIVYARFVLTHLNDPAAALARMIERLRPGGAAVIEDIDFSGHFCYPESPAFARYIQLYTDVVRGKGANANIGPRLPGLLLDSGCRNVQMNIVQPAGIEGEVKLLAAITMEGIADSVLAAGLESRPAIDEIIGELYTLAEDRRTVMSLPRVVQAWGYRETAA